MIVIWLDTSSSSSFVLCSSSSYSRHFVSNFCLRISLSVSTKCFAWDFDWDCMKPIDEFEENLYLYTTESSST